jgi:oligogalacturonide lyase
MKPARSRPEWKRLRDETTGAAILQWTSSRAMNHHFYFTNPTLSPDGTRGFFVSYRTGYPNLFSIELASGELTQLSDRVDLNPFSPSPSRTAPWIYVSAQNAVRAIHTETGEDRELCRFETTKLGNCSLSMDGSLLAVGLRFADHGELAIVETATGKFEIAAHAKEVGHIQFCPQNPDLLLYSGTVTQRIWLHDRRTGKDLWVYPQKPDEWIVHESWLGRGDEIIFTHWPRALRAIRPDGSGLRTVASVNAWHACASGEGASIVCDTAHPDRGLLLVRPDTGEYRVLCQPRATQRGTQWVFDKPASGPGIDTSILRSDSPENDKPPHPDDPPSPYGPQWSHPHPTFTTDGRSVVFTSDREGWSQVYQVEIPQ